MNHFTMIGFILAALVFGFGAATATDHPQTFLDFHAILIVIGGTTAASAICFPLDQLLTLGRVFVERMLRGNKKVNYRATIMELMVIAESYRNGSPELEKQIENSSDIFLKEAMTSLLDSVMDEKTLVRVLRMRVNNMFQRYFDDALQIKTVSKFPPAFGLMGTTLGMIALLQKLGEPGAQSKIGPAMAIGLVATLYGISLANFVFVPIAENLIQQAKEVRLKNTIIVEGVALIAKRVNPLLLAEELNSYLLPRERVDWKTGTRPAAVGKAA